MAKKRQPKDEQMPPATATPEAAGAKKPYPSRAKVKYVALPIDLYRWLEQYAKSRSKPYDEKSVAWAARQAVYQFKTAVESGASGQEESGE